METYELELAWIAGNIGECDDYLELRKYKNKVLSGLFDLDDKLVEQIFLYWERVLEDYNITVNGIGISNEILSIIEDYYKAIITDNWADEVGLKYYY